MDNRFVGLAIQGMPLLICLVAAVPARAFTEEEIRQKYLNIAEESVKHYETLWTDDSANIPNSGFFDFRKYDNWEPSWYAPEITVPGNGVIVFTYAVLLTETKKDTFTEQNIPRAVLLDHALKAIRWCCLTSAYIDHPYKFPIPGSYERRIVNGSWVRPIGHRTDVLGWLTVGAAILGDKLDADTRNLLEKVCIGAAPKQRYPRQWEYGQGGNQDVVKQDLGSTIGAAYLFPRRPDQSQYMDLIRAAGIDIVSTLHDRACNTAVEGKAVRDWAGGWNLYPDYSSDHHGWAQIWYGSDKLFEGLSYIEILSHLLDVPVPQTYTYPNNGFQGIIDWTETMCLPESEPASVHGMEYDAYYGAGLLAYCYAATFLKDPISGALEDRAAALLEKHSRAEPMYDYHRNSSAKAAAAYLLHKYGGPRTEPLSYSDTWQILNGAMHYRWQQAMIHRSNDRWASFSWGSISRRDRPRPVGFLVPARKLAADIEPLVYLHPESMAGRASLQTESKTKPAPADSVYRQTHSDAGFQTAGIAYDEGLERYYAVWSFDNGPYVCLTQFRVIQPGTLNWTGLPVYFYVREGLTGSREYRDAQGGAALEQAMDRKSDWWSVANALGLLAAGGNGNIRVERGTGNNWARTSAYRDKCDGVFVSPVRDMPVTPGDIPVNLAAALYPDKTFEQIAEAAKLIQHTSLSLPQGWKGFVAPDVPPTGRRFVAVANLFGKQSQATLSLSFPEGGPVLSRKAAITNRTTSCALNLAGLETFGHAVELYVEVVSGSAVFARQETPRLYEFHPAPGERAKVRLRYRGPTGRGLLIRPTTGEPARRVRLTRGKDGPPVVVDLTGVTFIGIEGPGYEDWIGPSVEILEPSMREDGRVTIEVIANDQSGVQSVELLCDGERLGQTTMAPYLWTHRPTPGYHTYQAVAVDSSSQANTRSSFKRTALVAAEEGSRPAPTPTR